MPKFFTAFNRRGHSPSPSGERYRIEHMLVLDERGQVQLAEKSRIDLVELHNADRDSVSLPLLMRRYCDGDILALEQRSDTFYADLTELPANAVEAANRAFMARQLFEGLSTDIKATFGNSVDTWLARLSEGDATALRSIGAKVIEKTSESEVPASAES